MSEKINAGRFKIGDISPRKGVYQIKQLVGNRYGRLVVVDYDKVKIVKRKPRGNSDENNCNHYWNCICDCGNKKSIRQQSLLYHNVISCGCKQRDVAISKRLPNFLSIKRKIYSRYKKQALQRNILFDLNFDLFVSIISNNCYYCNTEPSNTDSWHSHLYTYNYNGIDRVDNSIGYFSNNVVSCCALCNMAKRDMSKVKFLDLIGKIYNNRIG